MSNEVRGINPSEEGWDLFEVTAGDYRDGLLMIQRDDGAGIFATDDEAIAHVVEQARAGSMMHHTALTLHMIPASHLSLIAIDRLCAMACMLDEVAAGIWKPTGNPYMVEQRTPVNFDYEQDQWLQVVDSDDPQQGYTACPIGFAMLDSRLALGGSHEPQFAGASGREALSRFFEINEASVSYLFESDCHPATPEAIAARIRGFISHGGRH